MTVYTFINELDSIITKIFKQIHLYTILIQGISILLINQIPTHHVFRKVHFVLA
jgi:hypothetical protein